MSRADLIKLLLSKGANVNAQDQDGNTALSLATTADKTEIVTLLKAAGAK